MTQKVDITTTNETKKRVIFKANTAIPKRGHTAVFMSLNRYGRRYAIEHPNRINHRYDNEILWFDCDYCSGNQMQ